MFWQEYGLNIEPTSFFLKWTLLNIRKNAQWEYLVLAKRSSWVRSTVLGSKIKHHFHHHSPSKYPIDHDRYTLLCTHSCLPVLRALLPTYIHCKWVATSNSLWRKVSFSPSRIPRKWVKLILVPCRHGIYDCLLSTFGYGKNSAMFCLVHTWNSGILCTLCISMFGCLQIWYIYSCCRRNRSLEVACCSFLYCTVVGRYVFCCKKATRGVCLCGRMCASFFFLLGQTLVRWFVQPQRGSNGCAWEGMLLWRVRYVPCSRFSAVPSLKLVLLKRLWINETGHAACQYRGFIDIYYYWDTKNLENKKKE